MFQKKQNNTNISFAFYKLFKKNQILPNAFDCYSHNKYYLSIYVMLNNALYIIHLLINI